MLTNKGLGTTRLSPWKIIETHLMQGTNNWSQEDQPTTATSINLLNVKHN